MTISESIPAASGRLFCATSAYSRPATAIEAHVLSRAIWTTEGRIQAGGSGLWDGFSA